MSAPASVGASDALHIDQVIPLKDSEGPFPFGLEDIYKVGDKFIAHDRTQIVYVFDDKGRLISSSEFKIGHGPEEYSNMLAYTFNPYSNNVEIITPLKMKIYDLKFNFIEDRDIPSSIADKGRDGYMFSEIYDLDKDVHALVPSGISHNNNSIVIYDSKKGKVVKTIDYDSDIVGLVNMQKHSFTDLGDSIVFYPPGISKYVYSFDKQNLSLSKEIKIDGLDFEYDKDGDEDRYRKYVMGSDALMPLRLLVAGDKLCFLAKEGNNLDGLSYLVSDECGKMNKFMIKNNGRIVFPIITFSDGKSIFGLSDGEELNDYYDAMNLEFPDSLKLYPTVILSYKLK